MILSKGQKMIIAAVLVVLLGVGGSWGYNAHQENQKTMNDTIKALMKEELNESEEYNFEALRDDKSFQKELVKAIDEMVEVATYNEPLAEKIFYDDSIPEEQKDEALEKAKKTDRFGIDREMYALSNGLSGGLFKMAQHLSDFDYEDEAVRDSFKKFFLAYEQVRAEEDSYSYQPNTDGYYELERFRHYGYLISDNLLEWNDGVDDFYKIDIDEIITEEEAIEFATQAVELSYAAGEKDTFCVALGKIQESSLKEKIKEKINYMDEAKIFDFLVGDSTDMVTTLPGVGGYYDTQEKEINKTYYGDFCIKFIKGYSRQEYDMSGMTPELWNSLDQGYKDIIEEGNRDEPDRWILYLRDKEVRGTISSGFDYGYMILDDEKESILLVSPKGISVDIYGGVSTEYLEGDFSEQYAATEKAYKEAHSAAPTDEQAEAETEKVAGE